MWYQELGVSLLMVFGGPGLDGGGRSSLFSRRGMRRRGNRRRGSSRLTLMGRLALLGIATAVLGLGWLGYEGVTAWGANQPTSLLPSVSAAAPPPRSIEILPDPPTTRDRFGEARLGAAEFDPAAAPRLVEFISPATGERTPRSAASSDAWRVEYSLDEKLTGEVFEVLRKGRVDQGHAIVIDPRTGRLLVYASTDQENFPPDQAYPAASIVKVLTAAAMLEAKEQGADTSCVYRGNKYRLSRRRLDRPKSGRKSGLEDAIATSNNQCFSQWALHVLGEDRLRSTFERFGWLSPSAPGHAPGRIELIETRLDLGRLGSGLDGLRVTPLHVASLTGILTDGRLIEPWWVDRVVDQNGRSVPLPDRAAPRQVLPFERAEALREMMVATTTRGTAKSAFRTRRGRYVLGDVKVAGKTGNLTGQDPYGRYEWFVGLAPADDPRIGVVVLQLQSNLWWKKSSELAANILKEVFCDRNGCRAQLADRWTGDLGLDVAPIRISNLDSPFQLPRIATNDTSASR